MGRQAGVQILRHTELERGKLARQQSCMDRGISRSSISRTVYVSTHGSFCHLLVTDENYRHSNSSSRCLPRWEAGNAPLSWQQQKAVLEWGMHLLRSVFSCRLSLPHSSPPLFFFTHCACLVAQAPSKNPFPFLFLFFSQPCWDALAQMRKKGGKEYVMGERREKKKGWSRKVPHDILELEPSSAPLPAVAMRKFPHKSSPQPLPSSPFTSDKVGSFFTRMEILWIEDGAQNEDRCLEVPVPSASFLK